MPTIGGPSTNKGASAKKGASPVHFLRVLEFARPFRRTLAVAVACVVFVALTYSLNILALLPLIKVIADEQPIPTWLHQMAAQDRLDVRLPETRADPAVLSVGDKSPLRDAVRAQDVLIAVNGDRTSPADMFRALAHAAPGEEVTLRFRRPADGRAFDVTARLPEVPWYRQWMLHVAEWLPPGDSDDSRFRLLFVIAGIVLIIGVVGGVCRFFGEYLISLVAGKVVLALRKRMYDRVLALPVAYFASHGVADLMTRFVQDSQDIYRGLVFVFAKSLREPLKAIFVFGAALIIDWRMTLLVVVAAPLAGIIIRRFGKRIRRANKRLLADYGTMLATLEGALNGIRVVKGYAMEKYERRHLHAVDNQIFRQQLKIARIEALASPMFETVGRIAATVAVLYFAHLMLNDRMTFSEFGTLAACMAGIFDPIRKMSSFYNRMMRANAALDRVYEVIDMPVQVPDDHLKPALPPFAHSIEFRDVAFTYPGANQPAIDGVNLRIGRGEKVAFVGPNGSGKTTLLSLLLRFFDPERGALLIDGRDVRNYSLASLRRQMSLITQDTVIFADTLANNIAYGDDELIRRIVLQQRHPERKYELEEGRARIVEAARAAFADDFIREKPQGYDTFVGEKGAQLSGGQKQRVAIARAILRNAPIFIFDEATSQIDAESEQKIHDAVEKFLKDRTALIIAHRFSTILQADRIVVMDAGRIVDIGRHEELIKRCELYKSLYGSQIIRDEAGQEAA